MPQSEPYRVGLIGCGRIGSEWDAVPPVRAQTHAGAFYAHPQCALVAGANRGQARLDAFGRKWGVTGLYRDYRQMLEGEALDIVCIATHPEQHHEQVLAAAQAGARAIFCEKPMALSLAECDEMIAACQEAGTILAINHSRRWDPTYRKAKELVDEGAIGRLLTMVSHCEGVKPYPAWRAEEEGPLLHDATHSFDLFRLYAGDAAWVMGTAVRRSRPFQLEDESMSIVTFRNGVSGVAIVNELTEFHQFDLELIGTHGKIVLGMGENRLWGTEKAATRDAGGDPNIEWQELKPLPFPEVPSRTPMEEAASDLVGCLETGGTPLSTGEDGRAAIEIIMAIYECERRGHVRVDLPLPGGPSTLHLMRQEGFYA